MAKWVPKLKFENLLTDNGSETKKGTEATHVYHARKGDSYATVYHRVLVSGSFSCKMNLRTFPFDQQRLCVRVCLWNCPEKVMGRSTSIPGPREDAPTCRTIKFERGDSLVYGSNFAESDAWTLLHNVEVKQGLTAVGRNDDFIQVRNASLDLI